LGSKHYRIRARVEEYYFGPLEEYYFGGG